MGTPEHLKVPTCSSLLAEIDFPLSFYRFEIFGPGSALSILRPNLVSKTKFGRSARYRLLVSDGVRYEVLLIGSIASVSRNPFSSDSTASFTRCGYSLRAWSKLIILSVVLSPTKTSRHFTFSSKTRSINDSCTAILLIFSTASGSSSSNSSVSSF